VILNIIRIITIYFVALLMYFSKINCHFLYSLTEFCIVWDDLSSSMLPFPQMCGIQNHPKLYHLTLQTSVSQNDPQTYLFLFPRNLCHIKWAVSLPAHFLWILSHVKLSDNFLSPVFQSSVWCTVLPPQRLIPSSYVILSLRFLTCSELCVIRNYPAFK
jgi:hypothetical protein